VIAYVIQHRKIRRDPREIRAVTAANEGRRITLFIPCHRIIGKEGVMTGYVGGVGSVARKEWLIARERKQRKRNDASGWLK